jgi:hypothetical protein
VPFAKEAVTFALASAIELGQRLIVANFVERPPLPLSAILGYEELPYPPDLAAAFNAPAVLARSLGITVTRLRVKSLHPIDAMLETIAEEDAGLFVFGPDRRKLGWLRYRLAAHAVRSHASSLIWLET